MTRAALSGRRSSYNFTIEFQGERYDVTAGHYDDGRIGEIFINRVRDKRAAKLGAHLDAACRDAAIVISMLLQHGTRIEELKHSLTREEDGEPMSILGVIVDHLDPGKPESDCAPADQPRPPTPLPALILGEHV